MRKAICLLSLCGLGSALWSLTRPPDIPFNRGQLDLGASETAAVADVNGDGKLDIISGENWYDAAQPKPHHFRDLPYANGYIDNFSDLPIDVDGDGRIDIVSCSWFRKSLRWWKNTGTSQWTENSIQEGFPIEFAFLIDLTNSKKPSAVLPQFGDTKAPLAWYEVKNGGFQKHVISDKSYGHGIGAGDVNNDGRTDIITPKGWFEAPSTGGDDKWIWHPDYDLGTSTGFIYAIDLNGDGRNDLITTAAHDYGIFWMEQGPNHQWTKHVIDDTWSQSHAMTMVDLNGDGKPDFLTGKRYMAHDHDPGAREPLGLYWYEFLKGENGSPVWVKHMIDYGGRVGAGMQLPAVDLNGDGTIDFVAPGKSGLFLFLNTSKRGAHHETRS
ncbi:MAG: FG-GAP repeat domain-containing protein [Bryobacteraceae bacterium]